MKTDSLPATPERIRQQAAKLAVSQLLALRKALENTPGIADALNTINKAIRELRAEQILSDAERLEMVRTAIVKRHCYTYEDIQDELNFALKISVSRQSVKDLVKKLIDAGEVETLARFVIGRPNAMGTIIKPKSKTA